MKQAKFMRSVSLALALLLATAALPFGALAAQTEPHPLEATDILLDETHFEYTGEEIRPNVTVRVKDQLLTLDRDYTLEYKDNVQVGTATVVVTGIEASGYTGTAEHPFYIDPRTSDDEQTDPVTILGTDVVLEGTEFLYTGQAIEPAVTVTVAGKLLTAGEDYTLVYENNVQPGTGSVTVTGVAARGYTGSVTIHFTIQAPAEEPTQPEETQPEETRPEETTPPQTEPIRYKITQGNGAVWHKNSGKELSFSTDGLKTELVKVLVDGKTVNSKYYTVTGQHAVIALKESFLQHLENGKYTITAEFTDGVAEGVFKISAPMDDSNPKTGDTFPLHLWTALLFIGITGLTGIAFCCRKKLW